MVACDFDLRFVYVRAGWEGSASDARILQRSIEQGFEVPRGKYYLVDAGYANTPNFIAPYRGVRYHLQEQDAVEDFDNEAEETIVPNGDESYGEDVDTMNSERNAGARKRDEIAM
ncbi:uncharacterized protein LOC120282731 [Dioscorea cayenensis subsp. rotundata]|uniref:Uncharacterized protein LOC120282731 n=1 Tax=Dioscorea cayennensis subsp. rotundata TaxID=55577 RepID=A0AB40D1E7_DIOCR|nr:uncharacterized protein LOC120282731 [Dioscorea cayenensis subsp. rotundata]